MRALRYSSYAGEISLEKVTVPAVGEGEVLVRVTAAALNPLDVKLHSGVMQWFFSLQLPYTMGSDLAGVVEQVGGDVTDPRPGDRVIARCAPLRGGAFAEFAVVAAHDCAALPGSLPFERGAAIPTAAGTAWTALMEIGRLEPGQSVLIHAGAGGVGSFAIQFAKSAGAVVVATASGDGVPIVEQLGADDVIDYRTTDFTRLPAFDVVLDTVGSTTQERSYDVLKPGGHLISVVSEPAADRAAKMGLRVSRVYYRLDPGELQQLVDRVDRLKCEILIDQVYPFDEFEVAVARQASGRARGKIILNAFS